MVYVERNDSVLRQICPLSWQGSSSSRASGDLRSASPLRYQEIHNVLVFLSS